MTFVRIVFTVIYFIQKSKAIEFCLPHQLQSCDKHPKNYPRFVDSGPSWVLAKDRKEKPINSFATQKKKKNVKHTTAGDGTWILATDLGRTWFAKWHKTTPSVNADATSFGNDIFNRLSIVIFSWSISSVSSFWRSNSRRMVKLNFSAGISRFQDTLLQKHQYLKYVNSVTYFNERIETQKCSLGIEMRFLGIPWTFLCGLCTSVGFQCGLRA